MMSRISVYTNACRERLGVLPRVFARGAACAICAAAICLAGAACDSLPMPSPTPTPHEALSFDELLALEQADEQAAIQDSQTAADGTDNASDAVSNIAGVYKGNHSEVPDEYQPYITLSDDKTAVFHANLLSAMGDVKGTWEYSGGVVSFYVDEVTFNGFTGQDVEQMDFEVGDGVLTLTHIMPATTIGMTVERDVFQKAAS